jgi:hypothetical protein
MTRKENCDEPGLEERSGSEDIDRADAVGAARSESGGVL